MNQIKEQAEALQEHLTALRRTFHQHPEISLQEFETAKTIERELNTLEIPHHRVGETGVVGFIKGQPGGKTIVLRADTDALAIQEESDVAYRSQNEGVMHACGHDFHTAALLGAARLLQEQQSEFCGDIRLFFQQAEEVGQGATQFIDAGLLEGVGRVFGLHAASDIPAGKVSVRPGPNNAAVDYFRIAINGKAAHVSTPHKGADALYIASQIVVAVQAIVTRLTSPIEPIIIGIGKLTAGTAYNIVAETAVLEGTVRTMTPETRALAVAKITETATQIAALYGGTASLAWKDYASSLINDDGVCKEVCQTVSRLFGPEALVTDRDLSLGGDDFAQFLLQVPGAYAFVGTGNPDLPGTVLPHHNGRFDVDESTLPMACALLAGYALQWLDGEY